MILVSYSSPAFLALQSLCAEEACFSLVDFELAVYISKVNDQFHAIFDNAVENISKKDVSVLSEIMTMIRTLIMNVKQLQIHLLLLKMLVAVSMYFGRWMINITMVW